MTCPTSISIFQLKPVSFYFTAMRVQILPSAVHKPIQNCPLNLFSIFKVKEWSTIQEHVFLDNRL